MTFLQSTWDILVRLITAAGAFLWGNQPHVTLIALVGLMTLDFIAALVAASMGRSGKSPHGRLDSRIGFRGISHKVMILVAVAAAALIDQLLDNAKPMLRSAVTMFYGVNEALSLLENLALCGVPIPPQLLKALEASRAPKSETPAPPPEADSTNLPAP